MESSSALGVIIIDAVGAVISLACIVFILTKSKEVVIKRSQPFFMVMFLVGALVCQVASIPFLGVADDVSCALRPLLISTGAALMLSSLVVKMLRIKKILSTADKLVSKAVMVKDLLPTFLTMYAVALGIWVVYVATEAPESGATEGGLNQRSPLEFLVFCSIGAAPRQIQQECVESKAAARISRVL